MKYLTTQLLLLSLISANSLFAECRNIYKTKITNEQEYINALNGETTAALAGVALTTPGAVVFPGLAPLPASFAGSVAGSKMSASSAEARIKSYTKVLQILNDCERADDSTDAPYYGMYLRMFQENFSNGKYTLAQLKDAIQGINNRGEFCIDTDSDDNTIPQNYDQFVKTVQMFIK